ncbi:L-type lectin-domain containing receptor kinase IX.1-like [Phragmites australis]|uniref:L-type lectin-domain containing receptor kinase IX.1-like n=1 Tax=Phragmites australis TaxID=29695 RepID=UPI002D792F2F|nr:L-type lectin-domain containing receptor kinase IX.1-like [Phragmites australis]
MAAASLPPFPLMFLRLYCFLVLYMHVPSASSLSFSFNFSKTGDPCSNELVCRGDSSFANSVIELTRKNYVSYDGQGRVWYATPVPLWNAVTGELASFSTTFSFKITLNPKSPAWADGMAFFLAHYYSNYSVLASGVGGGHLGLFTFGNAFNATGDSQVVAVEFDTYLNVGWDKSDQHVGIDVNSLKSVASTDTTAPGFKNRTSDSAMNAAVHYDNWTKLLTVDLQIDDTLYHVNKTVDLKQNLPDTVAVGFSASTGYGNVHQLLSWSFNSTLENTTEPISKRNTTEPSTKSLFKVLVPILVVSVCAIVGLLIWLRQKLRKIEDTDDAADSEAEEQYGEAEFEKVLAGPRRYLYRELTTATGNFAEENLLGRGGFGSVYKGCLPSDADDVQQAAIKKFSLESSQGRKEFEAEVKIISRLRHRNLVQLLGWCDSLKGLLLVYELVPEGSLDKHIHNNERLLTWSERYKIILGLGSALRYLHCEWEQCVVHGDIKPSNIMLDSSYNAKLGDFGLARLVDHGTGPRTTGLVQGTAGYIDPEFVNTRRPSTESDVYSFGIVLLEIVSGRQPVVIREGVPPFVLLKWVWSLYCQGATLDAADKLLRGDKAEERQMERALVVGLWCAHHDPGERLSVTQAMHALQSEDVKLPTLSLQMYKPAAPPSGVSGTSFSSGVRSSVATGTTTRSSEWSAT